MAMHRRKFNIKYSVLSFRSVETSDWQSSSVMWSILWNKGLIDLTDKTALKNFDSLSSRFF